jgi:hypothetical protein
VKGSYDRIELDLLIFVVSRIDLTPELAILLTIDLLRLQGLGLYHYLAMLNVSCLLRPDRPAFVC